jgi:cardiolipin synthase
MEEMYVADLAHATEIVLEQRRRVRPAHATGARRRRGTGGGGSRAAAGALRIGNALTEALGTRRLHGPAERRLMVAGASILTALGAAAIVWPRAVAWPFGLLCGWMGLALLARALRTRARVPTPAVPAIRSREERT